MKSYTFLPSNINSIKLNMVKMKQKKTNTFKYMTILKNDSEVLLSAKSKV